VTGMGEIVAVNTGYVVDAERAGRRTRTAIDKRPVSGRVAPRLREILFEVLRDAPAHAP
jgi:hypothetical protein